MAFGFFALQILISRGKWMGGGDLRMAIIMGLLLGWKATLLALFLSYFFSAGIGLGLISLGEKKLSSEMPFGPFLALGTVLTLFWGQEIVTTYEQLMRLII
jgi:prepilin signal peptidase PulO-like enzyme (type II secretory pathway)